MAKVRLVRGFSFGDRYYDPGVADIPGIEDAAKVAGKKLEDFIPKGASIVTDDVTMLPKVHPTVTTLSEMAKVPATDAVTASKGPFVTVSDAAMAGKPEAQTKPVEDDEFDFDDKSPAKGKK